MKKYLMAGLFVSVISTTYAQSIWDAPTEKLQATPVDIVVYRSPSCGCCSKWVAHLKKHDFNVIDHVTNEVQTIKDQQGVSQSLASCHTATINGYVIEGHVPAGDIKALLKDKPNIKGLAVPGMVVGTPGMEVGMQKAPFKVLAFDRQGNIQLYKTYQQY